MWSSKQSGETTEAKTYETFEAKIALCAQI